MSLSSLVESAKTTTKKWWKWILGVIIGLVIVYVMWRLRKQANDIVRLEAELTAQKELVKDLKVKLANASDDKVAQQIRDSIEELSKDILVRGTDLGELKKTHDEIEARVKEAEDWKKLH